MRAVDAQRGPRSGEGWAVNILPRMAQQDSPTPAPIDARAAQHQGRRMARAEAPPWLHGEVARRMGERLQVIRAQPATVLDWGGFVGASEAVLDAAYPKAARWTVEPEAVESLRARRSAPRWWSARRWTGPSRQVFGPDETLPGTAELVWSNMLLHGVADPPALLARWHAALAVDGFVMFSCLGPDTARELRGVYQRHGWGPASAPFVDMHDLGDMLVHAGFADPVMDQETVTLHWSDAEAALTELRSLGGNLAIDRHAGLRTPRWRQRLISAMRELAGPDGRPAIRFEIAYGHAFKPLPRPRVASESRVSMDDMRVMLKRGTAGGS